MANINININAYFTLRRPATVKDYSNESEDSTTEALWFSAADVLEYIKSTGLEKQVYIGLLGFEDLYILESGEIHGCGAFKELANGAHPSYSAKHEFKKIYDLAKKVFLESKDTLPNYADTLYQFSPEDTQSLVSLVFSHPDYKVTISK